MKTLILMIVVVCGMFCFLSPVIAQFIVSDSNIPYQGLTEIMSDKKLESKNRSSDSLLKKEKRKNTVQNMFCVSTLKFIFLPNISYFTALNDGADFGIGIQKPWDNNVSGIGMTFEIRFREKFEEGSSFYFAPNASTNFLSVSGSDLWHHSNISDAGFQTYGIMIGWLYVSKGLSFDFGFGMDYYSLNQKDNLQWETYKFLGIEMKKGYDHTIYDHFYDSWTGSKGIFLAVRLELIYAW